MQDGLCSWQPAQRTADGSGATASIVTLEDVRVVLHLGMSGVRAESCGGSDAIDTSISYDSVSSFLLNNSTGFVAHFNSSLAAQLMRVVQEREENGEAAVSEGGDTPAETQT